MKKFVLTGLTFLGFTATIFAQNTSTLNQIGTSQTSEQKQAGNKLSSAVMQGSGTNTTSNTYNKSWTDQSGSQQTATVRQDEDADYNQARITQINSGNTASVEETGISTSNKATISQQGTNNTGTIQQNTNSGGTGIGNTAELFQKGSNNATTSIQQNTASHSNQAYLNQYGNNNNETRITQSNNSHNNLATINMGGDGPNGQYPNGWTPVNNGTAIIEQTNESHDNTARIGQSGNGHDGRIYQNNNVDNSVATIDQYPSGVANTALIRQTNSTFSKASIIQNQNSFGGANGHNLAEVFQGNNGSGLSSDNITTVIQENANNISRNEQLGTNNLVDVSQAGNGNIVAGLNTDAIARQAGSDNRLYITQNNQGGTANIAHVSQMGTGNTATINQTGK